VLPAYFAPGPRLTWLDAVGRFGWDGPPAGSVLVVVRSPVPYGRAAPAVFFVPGGQS
jgi:hypothetical protein